MIDETMLPREGLFDRIFSVLAEIRHPKNSTKLADINSIRPASSKRLTERKEALPAWKFNFKKFNFILKPVLQAIFTIQTGS